MDEKPRRRWFRFSLRTLFVLVTAFCVWLAFQLKWIRDRHAALDWISSHNGVFSAASDTVITTFRTEDGPRNLIVWATNPASRVEETAPWSIRVFGERGIATIVLDLPQPELDERVAQIERLFPEAHVAGTRPEALKAAKSER